MKRRAYLATATSALLAGCRFVDDPSPTPANTTAAEPTETSPPATATTRSPTETDAQTETDAPTETDTPTETERPPSEESAEQLAEARERLNRAVRRYAEESHRIDASTILDVTADSSEFTPTRVTGSVGDARLSLSRAERRANATQMAEVERLRAFAAWLEHAVAIQVRVASAADDCRAAVAGSVPHDYRETRRAYDTLSMSVDAASAAADSFSVDFRDVGDRLDALQRGHVREKTDQLLAEIDTLEQLASLGERIADGIGMVRRAKGERYTVAVELARDAVDEFEAVEVAAGSLGAPDSLVEERDDMKDQATDWREHAEDEVERYEDELTD